MSFSSFDRKIHGAIFEAIGTGDLLRLQQIFDLHKMESGVSAAELAAKLFHSESHLMDTRKGRTETVRVRGPQYEGDSPQQQAGTDRETVLLDILQRPSIDTDEQIYPHYRSGHEPPPLSA